MSWVSNAHALICIIDKMSALLYKGLRTMLHSTDLTVEWAPAAIDVFFQTCWLNDLKEYTNSSKRSFNCWIRWTQSMKEIENKEQRIRISTYQKLSIPQYMISDCAKPLIIYRVKRMDHPLCPKTLPWREFGKVRISCSTKWKILTSNTHL